MANKAASDLGQLALRRPLSAQDRSPGCPRLRPAAAKQPVGRRWHPGHICGAWYRRRQRTGSGSASPSCASAAPRRRCPPSPSPSPSPASASCAGARGCRRCPRSGCASPCCHEPPRRRARVREGRFDRGGTADPCVVHQQKNVWLERAARWKRAVGRLLTQLQVYEFGQDVERPGQ